MRKHVAIALGTLALGIAASGCSGGNDAEAESRPVTTIEHVETRPGTQAVVDISKFRAAFKETFGARAWYRQITGMKLKKPSRTLEVTMKLDPEKIDVGTICEAVFRVADNAGVRNRIDAVRVIASDGSDGGCA